MKGRKPKPTALKLLQGNPGHRPIDSSREPKPVVGLGEPPEVLHGDPEAMRYWMSQGAELVKIKTITEVDAALFAGLCMRWSRIVWLSRQINDLRGKNEISEKELNRLETMESQRMKTQAAFDKAGAEFGVGAASRTRIKVGDPAQREFSEVESSFDKTMRLAGSR